MRFSEDETFDAAQGNLSVQCNPEGGAVSKDIPMKIFYKNFWDKRGSLDGKLQTH